MATRRAARQERDPDPDPDPDPDWAGMAALPEKTVNGWVLQFYFHRAIEAYRSGRNRDFRQFRDIMQALLVRPLDREPEMAQMLRIMQLLSRVEEGENLGKRRDPPPKVWMPILIDCTFEKESELTPLESAMLVLDFIHEEFSVADKTMDAVQKMVKEAAVIVCIRNKEFDKASDIVKKHMGKEPKNQKRNEWLAVIREKNPSHPKIKNFSYEDFQQSIFEFLKGYVDDSEPALLTLLKKTLNSEHTDKAKSSLETPEFTDGLNDQAAAPEASGRAEGPARAPEASGRAEGPARAPEASGRAEGPARAPEASGRAEGPARAPEVLGSGKGPARAPEASGRAEGPARAPEVLGSGKGPARAPEASGRAEGPARAPEVLGSGKGPARAPEVLGSGKGPARAPEVSGRVEDPARVPEPAGAAEDLEGAASPADRAAGPTAAPEIMEEASDPAATLEPMEIVIDPAATPEHLTAASDLLNGIPEPMEIAKEPAATTPELPGMSNRESQRQPPGAVTACGISVLREAFKILSNSGDSDALFTKLDETDLPSPKQLSPSVSHRTKRCREAENQDSETSQPPEIPHNIKNLFSISNLIVELDGSSSKSSESPDSSQEHVVSSASKPAQKLPDEPLSAQSEKSFQGKWNSSCGTEEKDSWSDEDELFANAASLEKNNSVTKNCSSKKQKWTIQESEWIKEGVKKYGEGRWKAICLKYPFQNRTSVMIKDRWRTMKKLGML
ncbi:telomeric repeat-binding factor 2 isoform X2 [Aphelocoma coerulescens]|uniref:telomeric repeat-binding factor 2 isoform X2 n=1 Tax=Aphelocoma coerulescens TaxID=39617 RepID=UPI003604F6DA